MSQKLMLLGNGKQCISCSSTIFSKNYYIWVQDGEVPDFVMECAWLSWAKYMYGYTLVLRMDQWIW